MKINQLSTVTFFFLFIFFQEKIFAQMGMNASGTAPAINAMLDISSTTKGLLIPRMNTIQRNALAHTQGLTVYDITTNSYWYSDGAVWVNIATISSASPWLTSGNNIYNNNTGNVGIGTSNPVVPLNIYVGTNSGIARTQYQTVNTGILPTDGFFTGIANFGMNAFVVNYENAGLIFGTNGNANMKIDEIGNVGIGTITPLAALHVQNKSVLFNGLNNFFGIPQVSPPVSGKGNQTLWYAEKAAFRTGGVYNNSIFGVPDADTTNFHNWDKDSIGVFSFASGFNTKAKGDFSVAMGHRSFAIGNASATFGHNNVSKGNFSLTAGFGNLALGQSSTAFGNYSVALGDNSFASGEFITSSGNDATAFGANTEASGNFSTAFGNSTTASGANSTAMGRNATTNNYANSFCLAGIGTNLNTSNTAPNQMMMRFDNYTFYVAGTNNYAYIIPSSNGWAYTSDRNRKENFEELNGESVLKKIAKIPFYSWNFKDKEVKQYRHYGIMAQDFYDNFGKDNLGVIGNDTTVSALNLLGVAYSGIKALEKRTKDLQNQNEILIAEIAELKVLILPKRKKYVHQKKYFVKKEELITLK